MNRDVPYRAVSKNIPKVEIIFVWWLLFTLVRLLQVLNVIIKFLLVFCVIEKLWSVCNCDFFEWFYRLLSRVEHDHKLRGFLDEPIDEEDRNYCGDNKKQVTDEAPVFENVVIQYVDDSCETEEKLDDGRLFLTGFVFDSFWDKIEYSVDGRVDSETSK